MDFPKVFIEALCVHRIFGAAGIPMDDVYMIPQCVDPVTGVEGCLGVLARQGDRTFSVAVGPLGMSVEEFAKRWPEAVAAWRELPTAEAKALTDRAEFRDRAVEVLLQMAMYDFQFQIEPPSEKE